MKRNSKKFLKLKSIERGKSILNRNKRLNAYKGPCAVTWSLVNKRCNPKITLVESTEDALKRGVKIEYIGGE